MKYDLSVVLDTASIIDRGIVMKDINLPCASTEYFDYYMEYFGPAFQDVYNSIDLLKPVDTGDLHGF